MVNLDAVRKFFAADRFAIEQCGIEIVSAAEGDAVCQMNVTKQHLNAGNVVQGGAVFTLGDFAYAIAANCGGTMAVTLDNNISFVAPATGTYLRAHAVERASSNRLCFYDVFITNDQDVLVAKMTVTGYKKGTIEF